MACSRIRGRRRLTRSSRYSTSFHEKKYDPHAATPTGAWGATALVIAYQDSERSTSKEVQPMALTDTAKQSKNDPFAAIRAERAENQRRLAREDPEALAAKIRAKLPLTNCAMCRVEFRGYGHNAQPILQGVVCDDCNMTVLRQRTR